MTDQPADPQCEIAHGHDPQCDIAHGAAPLDPAARTLVAVFASAVADHLLRYAADAGYQPVLLEPDADRAAAGAPAGVKVASSYAECSDPAAVVVMTDHHRPELGVMLRDILAGQSHWIGLMGSPRHVGPHVAALTELGVPPAEITRVHRPIGLNIGSRTPAEIAISTMAGLIAERNDCPGGFSFSSRTVKARPPASASPA